MWVFLIIEFFLLSFKKGPKALMRKVPKKQCSSNWATSDKLTCILKPNIDTSENAYEALKE